MDMRRREARAICEAGEQAGALVGQLDEWAGELGEMLKGVEGLKGRAQGIRNKLDEVLAEARKGDGK